VNFLWGINIVGEFALLALILWRREHVRFPHFTAYIAFCYVRSLVLLSLYPPDSLIYAQASFVFGVVRIVFIMAVLVDMLYWVVKPYLMMSATKSTMMLGSFALLSVYSAYIGLTDPAHADHWLVGAVLTADRSITLALAGAVVILVLTPRMRQKWTVRERGIVLGFLNLVPQSLQFALRYHVDRHTAALLDNIKMGVFTVALIVWISHFLAHEPAVASFSDAELEAVRRTLGSIRPNSRGVDEGPSVA
jgi:hypothetical protein